MRGLVVPRFSVKERKKRRRLTGFLRTMAQKRKMFLSPAHWWWLPNGDVLIQCDRNLTATTPLSG